MKKLLLIAMLVMSANAIAQTCTPRVVDESGVLAGHVSEVESAIEQFKDIGADVYVRTISSMGESGTLDTYIKKLEATCPNWQTPQGRKGNLIIFIHAKKEKAAGIFCGVQFKQPIDQNYSRIIADHMRPYFRQDQHAQAFIAGMSETHRIIEQHLHPGQSNTLTIVHMDKALITIALLAVACIVVWLLLRWRTGVRQGLQEAKTEQQSAVIEKQQANNRLLEAELKIASLKSARAIHLFEEQLQQLEAAYQNAWNEFALYEPGVITVQPEHLGLNAEQYRQFVTRYKEVNSQLNQVERQITALEQKISSA